MVVVDTAERKGIEPVEQIRNANVHTQVFPLVCRAQIEQCKAGSRRFLAESVYFCFVADKLQLHSIGPPAYSLFQRKGTIDGIMW